MKIHVDIFRKLTKACGFLMADFPFSPGGRYNKGRDKDTDTSSVWQREVVTT
ncbi:hypothetical protein AAULR_01730 [Lacticaseibacillus rhamnosus MTCC 5462]|nr:hypothetical protein AAULR_01730 [Lacticaseibacillus rhamnosus MTCC 5462]